MGVNKRIDELTPSTNPISNSDLLAVWSDNRTERITVGELGTHFNSSNDTFVSGGTFDLSGGTLTLNLSNGSPVIVDYTDLINLAQHYTTGGTISSGDTLIFTQANGDTYEIDLSSFLDDTNDGVVSGATMNGNVLELGRTQGLSDVTVDLSQFLDDTNTYTTGATLTNGVVTFTNNEGDSYGIDLNVFSAQTISLSGTNLTISNGGNTIDLSSFLDDTNTYTTGGTLDNGTLTFNDNVGGSYSIDLSSFSAQTLSLSGTNLTISNGGNTIDLSQFLDDTNTYTTGATLTNSIATFNNNVGGSYTLDLNVFSAQTLSLSGTNLTISNGGNSVDLGDLTPWTAGTGDNSAVLKGSSSDSLSDNSVVAGLSHNIGTGSTTSVILGGNNNIIGSDSISSGIFVGSGHTINENSNYSVILGGEGNIISASTEGSVILGGTNNIVNSDYSVAMGLGSVANGLGSFAGGSGTTASGNYSHSEGVGNIASGVASHAQGGVDKNGDPTPNVASGNASFAGGSNTTASGNYSTSFGEGSIASGSTALAGGNGSIAGGSNSISFGNSSKSIGDDSVSFGYNNDVFSQYGGIFVGRNHTIYGGNNSTIVGGQSNTILKGTGFDDTFESSIIGGFNNSISGASRTVILGGANITATTSNTVYVPGLNIGDVRTDTAVNLLAVDSNGYVVDGSTLAGAGGSSITVEDEGNVLTTGVTKFNFVGAGVTTTEPVDNEVIVTISGGVSTFEWRIDPYEDVGNVDSITWDVSGTSTNYEATLTGVTTLDLINVRNGDYGSIIVKQDGVGGHTLSFGNVNGAASTHRVAGGGGGVPSLTLTNNSRDILSFTYNGSVMYWTVGNDYT